VDLPRGRCEKGRHQKNQIEEAAAIIENPANFAGFLFCARNFHPCAALNACHLREALMGRGLILWLLGIPLPIIILLALFGFFR
jgi:hypothetical protein